MVSAIVPSLPADGVPAVKADLRSNLANAKVEIEALQAQFATFPTAALNGMRNKLINGNFYLNGAASSGVVLANATPVFGASRWWGICPVAGGTFTMTPSYIAAPINEQPSFLTITVNTAKAVPAAGDVHIVYQNIEGGNGGDMLWGTASAKTCSLSFWAKSTIAGSYAIAIDNVASGTYQSYTAQYTIAVANVWEYKTIVILGPTTGLWQVTNDSYMRIGFDVGSGSTFTGAANTWGSTRFTTFAGATKLIATAGAVLSLTAVQFEIGTAATRWDYRMDQIERMLCERYYHVGQINFAGYNAAAAFETYFMPFVTRMRASPTIVRSAETLNNGNNPTTVSNANGMVVSYQAVATNTVSWTASYTASAELTVT